MATPWSDFLPGEKLNADDPQPYTFHNHPYHFYNHPPLAAYKLNKLLYDLRFKASLRLRAFQDVGAVAAEYGLNRQQADALKETFQFQHLDSDKPGQDADPLVRGSASHRRADGRARAAAGEAQADGGHADERGGFGVVEWCADERRMPTPSKTRTR